MSSLEVVPLGIVGALSGVLVATGWVGPNVMFSDAGYAMVGVVVSSLIGATATVLVTYITVNANRRRSRGDDPEGPEDNRPRKPR